MAVAGQNARDTRRYRDRGKTQWGRSKPRPHNSLAEQRASSGWNRLLGEADAAFFVVLSATVAAESFVGGAVFFGGVWYEIPAFFLCELTDLLHSLMQVHAGEVHSFRLGFFRAFEPLNPDCL